MFERSLNVRTIMQEIIKSEEHPLSDAEIVTKLGAQGYHVARRTVAKYRSLEGILPGRLRNSKKRKSHRSTPPIDAPKFDQYIQLV
jgi:RNA polymerase sigma-54 factor